MAIEAEALRAQEETEVERDALAIMLADCVAVMEQIPLTLLPRRVDMMLMSALDAPIHNVAATRAELIMRAKAHRSALAEDTARAAEIRHFAQLILHGEDEHRGWLTEAAEAFVAGTEMPPPRGKGAVIPLDRDGSV